MSNETVQTRLPGLKEVVQAWMYIRPFYVIITTFGGLTGNTLSIIVFIKYKSWRAAGIHFLFCLAISDSMNLILDVSSGLDLFGCSVNIFAIGHVTCVVLMATWWFTWLLSGWVIVVFTIERWFSINFAMKSATVDFVRFRKRALFTMIVVLLIICVPFLFMYTVREYGVPPNTFKKCNTATTGVKFFYYWNQFVRLGCSYFTPALTVLVFNFLLIISIMRSRFEGGKHTKESNRNKEINVATSLMMISSLYIITTIPGSVVWTWHDYIEGRGYVGWSQSDIGDIVSLGYLCTALNSINFSTNFLIYATKFDFFLSTLSSVCLCWKKRQ